MDFFSDVALLSRVQFAFTIFYHFLFVPISIGTGLFLAIYETRYYRTRDPQDAAGTRLWVKIFTATFAIGVATGLTMEFSFGTNWANYSRFVGNIFGAPLAAEGLFAFFLESVFLGVLLFGRNKVSPKFYLISAWLVLFGSCLSALWILIANSWMQTPTGAELSPDGTYAILTGFWSAAFNPTILSTYTHTVTALFIMGAFVVMAVSAWYLLKGKHEAYAMRALRVGSVIAIVTSTVMILFAHMSGVDVAREQPTKFAMMEGQYTEEVPGFAPFGIVDEENQELIAPINIPGATSFLATGTWDTEFPGLNDLADSNEYPEYAAMDVDKLPVNFVFQTYHIMIIMYGFIMITAILAIVFTYRHHGQIKKMKWLQRLLVISPFFPFCAIQTGWITAEVGRQPWVVYPSVSSVAEAPNANSVVSLLTDDAISPSVSSPELLITLSLFFIVYLILFIGWARVIGRFISDGPVISGAEARLVPATETATEAAAISSISGDELQAKTLKASSETNSSQSKSTDEREGE